LRISAAATATKLDSRCSHPRARPVHTAPIKHIHQGFGRIYQVACPTTPYLPGMKLKTAHIDIRVEPALIEKIDAWCNQQRVRPSRSAAIVHIIEEFLEHDLPSRHKGVHDHV
jgi:hypothetical protein